MYIQKRELHLIEEQIDSEAHLAGKFKSYSDETTDPQMRITYQQIAAKHQNYYQSLLRLLNEKE